jgi:Arc/MetJ-type ribon-helix-helix transcriptional regulator
MKLSVSLPERDIAIIDRYMQANAITSRSAVIQRAVDALQKSTLADEYEQAWNEWDQDGETKALWDSTVGDGLSDETR